MITKSMTKYLLVPLEKVLMTLWLVFKESDYDDPMNGLYGADEVDEILNDASFKSKAYGYKQLFTNRKGI